MPDWNDVLEKSITIVNKCDGWRHLIRTFEENWYHISRSGMQEAFKRDFGINTWEDMLAHADDETAAKDDEVDAAQDAPANISVSRDIDLRVAYFADTHYPFHDDAALSLLCNLFGVFKPNEVVFGGDAHDFPTLSTFDQDPHRMTKLQEELSVGLTWNERLNKAAGGAQWFFLPGNHDMRWVRYLHTHPQISNLDVLQLPNLLKLDKLGWEYVTERWYCGGELAMIHGERYSKNAGWAAKAELENRMFDQHIVQGHNHKCGNFSSRGPLRVREAYEVGCLCTLHPEWKAHANWNLGAMFVTIKRNVPHFENVMFNKDNTGVWTVFRGEMCRG